MTWGGVASAKAVFAFGRIRASRESGSEEQWMDSGKSSEGANSSRIRFIREDFPVPGPPLMRKFRESGVVFVISS